MVNVMCTTIDGIKLSDLVPFQGNLKKRTDDNIRELADSIQSDGLIMPFAVWKQDTSNMLLDGHGRLAALKLLASSDDSINDQVFPVIYIEADSEEQARKQLLQITSSYGKITKKGVTTFCASIPEYKAPAINKFVHKSVKRPRREKMTAVTPTPAQPEVKSTETVLKVVVPSIYETAVREMLASVSYIRII